MIDGIYTKCNYKKFRLFERMLKLLTFYETIFQFNETCKYLFILEIMKSFTIWSLRHHRKASDRNAEMVDFHTFKFNTEISVPYKSCELSQNGIVSKLNL